MNATQIVSLSGGKDSTAMLLMMLERNEPIEAVVFLDTGWEFPAMHDHLDLLEKNTGQKIWHIYPRIPFEYTMFHRPIRKKTGEGKGKIHRIGYGWPSSMRRWCTREKVAQIEYFNKHYDDPIQCVGYAADEKHRDKDNSKYPKRYPLIEYGITESEALKYCLDRSYHWDGLYDIFDRVSCYCCPLQKIETLKKLRNHFPSLWQNMIQMDNNRPKHNPGFKGEKSVRDYDKRFENEDKQMTLELTKQDG